MYEKTIKLLAEGEWLPGFLSVGRIKVERPSCAVQDQFKHGFKGATADETGSPNYIGTPISDGYFTHTGYH